MSTNQSTMGNMVGDTDFLGELDNSIVTANKKAKQRAQSGKYLRLFRMPEHATEADGTRRATIRFVSPFKGGAKIIQHDSWQKFRQVCPTFYGKDCQYCRMSEQQRKDGKINTTEWYLWEVFYYQGGRDNEGEAQLFAFPINNASPVPPLYSEVWKDENDNAKEEGRPPRDFTEFDIILTQHGEGAKRHFGASAKPARPFDTKKYGVQKAVDLQLLKDSFTYDIDGQGKPIAKALLGLDDDDVSDEEVAAVIKPDTDGDQLRQLLESEEL